MPKVKMRYSKTGSEDGILIKRYASGEIYDLNTELAESFVHGSKCADYYTEKVEAPIIKAPENKIIAKVPEVKEKPIEPPVQVWEEGIKLPKERKRKKIKDMIKGI